MPKARLKQKCAHCNKVMRPDDLRRRHNCVAKNKRQADLAEDKRCPCGRVFATAQKALRHQKICNKLKELKAPTLETLSKADIKKVTGIHKICYLASLNKIVARLYI